MDLMKKYGIYNFNKSELIKEIDPLYIDYLPHF